MKRLVKSAVALAGLCSVGVVLAQAPSAQAEFEADGTVRVPAFDLPPSPFMSKEAVELQKGLRARMTMPPGAGAASAAAPAMSPIEMMRRGAESLFAPRAQAMMKLYPADVAERRMGGVRTRVITPRGVRVDPRRVLINVHGGGFNTCADACGLMESLPIAWLGGFRVITVDYRMAPEHVFPAGTEDVTAVYRELLKTYRPSSIGMYGCSAGGALSAHQAAWLPAHGVPQLGAIGVFGSGAIRGRGGDSAVFGGLVDGLWRAPRPSGPPSAARAAAPAMPAIRSYFEGADMGGPIVSPATHPAVLRKFPPTLLITGTRAADMSPAVVTHSKLLEAGVTSQLIVGEGMGHCYIYESQLPESQFAYRAIAKFFQTHLR